MVWGIPWGRLGFRKGVGFRCRVEGVGFLVAVLKV